MQLFRNGITLCHLVGGNQECKVIFDQTLRESSKNFECYHTEEKINAEISIYKDKVAMVDYKTKENRMGVIIENKNITEALK